MNLTKCNCLFWVVSKGGSFSYVFFVFILLCGTQRNVIANPGIQYKHLDRAADTIGLVGINISKTRLLLSDMYGFVGVVSSGVHYSNHFRSLSSNFGGILGVEQYFPLKGKAFLVTGFNIVNRGFKHYSNAPDGGVAFRNTFIDVPINTAFELPILRELDFRIFFGANLGFRIQSKRTGVYDEIVSVNDQVFEFDIGRFKRMDFGWNVGLSAEYNKFLFKIKSYSGFHNIDRDDTGMLYTLNLEVGYFLFRTL